MSRAPSVCLLAGLVLGCGGGVVSSSPGDAGTNLGDAGSDALVPDTGSPIQDSGAIDSGTITPPDACGADIQNDPRNCGACGLDCGTSACVAGFCSAAPIVLASGTTPDLVAVGVADFYWSTQTPSSTIMDCPVGGCVGAPTVFWSGTASVDGLAVENATVVWPAQSIQGPILSGVVACSIAGCGSAPTALVQLSFDGVFGFGADTTTAYFSLGWHLGMGGNGLDSCAIVGCGGTPTVVMSYPNGGTNGAGALAVGGGNLVWIDEMGTVSTCPTGASGCAGSPVVVGAASPSTRVLAVDAHDVYWIDSGDPPPPNTIGPYTKGAIRSCPLSGCPAGGSTVLAAYPSWLPGAALAVDGSNAYWTTEDAAGEWGQIVRCSLGGCGGKPAPLATTATANRAATRGLALDATSVYWTDPGSGQVLTLPK